MTEKSKKKSGAQPGNINAMGYGRPPKKGFSDEEILVLGEELLRWMRDCDKAVPRIEVVHLSEFYSEIKGISCSYWDSITDRPGFSDYYDRSMAWMGKRIMTNKSLSPVYGSRFLGIYFKKVAEHELQQAYKKIDYEIKQKNKAALEATVSPNDSILDLKIKLAKIEGENEELKRQLNNAFKSKAKSESLPSDETL